MGSSTKHTLPCSRAGRLFLVLSSAFSRRTTPVDSSSHPLVVRFRRGHEFGPLTLRPHGTRHYSNPSILSHLQRFPRYSRYLRHWTAIRRANATSLCFSSLCLD